MIRANDWDEYGKEVKIDYTLPDIVESIEISYDRGRLSLYINKEEVYYDMSGMSDFNIEVNNREVIPDEY